MAFMYDISSPDICSPKREIKRRYQSNSKFKRNFEVLMSQMHLLDLAQLQGDTLLCVFFAKLYLIAEYDTIRYDEFLGETDFKREKLIKSKQIGVSAAGDRVSRSDLQENIQLHDDDYRAAAEMLSSLCRDYRAEAALTNQRVCNIQINLTSHGEREMHSSLQSRQSVRAVVTLLHGRTVGAYLVANSTTGSSRRSYLVALRCSYLLTFGELQPCISTLFRCTTTWNQGLQSILQPLMERVMIL
uniref:Uncharacterized protein n=1 Tax=Strigamia maritima TaxID=126957 RepID=T1IWL7_STRMM